MTTILEQLKNKIIPLQPGWLDGEGDVPDKAVLQSIISDPEKAEILSINGLTYVYPMPNGNIEIEWGDTSKTYEYNIEWYVGTGLVIILIYFEDGYEEEQWDMNEEESWEKLRLALEEKYDG